MGKVIIVLLLLFLIVGPYSQAHAISTPISVTTTDLVDDENDGQCDLYEALQAIFSQKSSGNPSVTYHECTVLAGPKAVVFEGAAAGGTISMPTGPGSLELPMINDDVTITGRRWIMNRIIEYHLKSFIRTARPVFNLEIFNDESIVRLVIIPVDIAWSTSITWIKI